MIAGGIGKDVPMSFCPDFLVVGAQKSGTSSLHAYLGHHPELFVPEVKEPHFFSGRGDGTPLVLTGVGSTWGSQFVVEPAAYAGLFAGAAGRVTGECSTSYLCDTAVPERVVAINPDVRIIVLLRDPAERAISGWRMARRHGGEPLSILEAIADEPRRMDAGWCYPTLYRHQSLYAEHLARWEQFVDPSQICILLTEDMAGDRVATLQKAFAHLGVDDSFVAADEVLENVTHAAPPKTAVEERVLRLRHSGPGRALSALIPNGLRRSARGRLSSPETKAGFEVISEEVRDELRSEFRSDTMEMQARYGLDLHRWLGEPTPPTAD